ncbi:MAG: efflux RND transporter periplasmic adaptor subunit [Pseudomonadota bacterium]
MLPQLRHCAAVLLGLAPIALGALPPVEATAQGRPAAVLVETVEMRQIADTTPVIGRLVGSVEAQVAARAAGVVDEVLFQVGDEVAAGQTLVRLDADLYEIARSSAQAALDAAEAGVETEQARLQLAEQGLQRQVGLQGSTAFSRSQFEDLEQRAAEARGELAKAVAEAETARAALARAEYDITHSEIKAPFAGVVVDRDAQPGAYVNLGDHIGSLLDLDRLEIEADAPASLAEALTPGTSIVVEFDGDISVEASVRAALPVEDVSTRTRAIRLMGDMSAVDRTLVAAGKPVTLQVPVTAPREAVMVPKDALVQSRGGWIVYTVEDGKAQPRSVALGQSALDWIEAISGVSPGDVVVVLGNERLRPGQAVNAKPAKTSAATEG